MKVTEDSKTETNESPKNLPMLSQAFNNKEKKKENGYLIKFSVLSHYQELLFVITISFLHYLCDYGYCCPYCKQ